MGLNGRGGVTLSHITMNITIVDGVKTMLAPLNEVDILPFLKIICPFLVHKPFFLSTYS